MAKGDVKQKPQLKKAPKMDMMAKRKLKEQKRKEKAGKA